MGSSGSVGIAALVYKVVDSAGASYAKFSAGMVVEVAGVKASYRLSSLLDGEKRLLFYRKREFAERLIGFSKLKQRSEGSVSGESWMSMSSSEVASSMSDCMGAVGKEVSSSEAGVTSVSSEEGVGDV